MVGYDLDGTISTKPIIDKKWGLCKGYERIAYQKLKKHHVKTAKLVHKPVEKRYCIITGRSPKLRCETLLWLAERGLKPISVYFIDRTRTRPNMIAFKSEKINELGLKKYYEDDPKIFKSLARKCPNTEVILVESVTKNYYIKNFLEPPLQI